jgi:RNA-dependent RNA polymerase
VPVDINDCPRRLIKYNPDWSSAEVTSIDKARYYESKRALGHLYRDFELPTKDDLNQVQFGDAVPPFEDNVTAAVLQQVQHFLPRCTGPVEDEPAWLSDLSQHYHNELRYICATHTLSNTGGVRLMEEEVVIGTILAECSQVCSICPARGRVCSYQGQRRWRKDRIQRMKMHSRVLTRSVETSILDADDVSSATREELISGLGRAWNAWCFSVRHRDRSSAPSFGLVALGLIFACIDQLERTV